jgi:hypothetical protein
LTWSSIDQRTEYQEIWIDSGGLLQRIAADHSSLIGAAFESHAWVGIVGKLSAGPPN